jgi:hypothetical protein
MKTTYRKILSRRTLLRAAGGVAIGLPFLEEMRPTSVYAAEPSPTVRAFNVFFGLGYQSALQDLGLAGSTRLVPAEPLVDKFGARLAFLRKIDQRGCNGEGNAHYDGSAGAFTGTPADRIDRSKNVTGGESIDQALRFHAYPNQLPAGVLNAMNTGTWWRYSDSTQRYIHSRLKDGSPAGDAVPPQDPKELFDKLFTDRTASPDPTQQDEGAAARARAMRGSILDALMDQYEHYRGPAGGLSAASRARITNYFEQIRSIEQEVAAGPRVPEAPSVQCGTVEDPGADWYSHRNRGDGDGIDITVEKVQREVQLMARLFAMGVACDRVRFGSFVFQSGGERIRLHGRYEYNGRLIADWDEDETSHELWHQNNYDRCAEHLHFVMNQIAYFLEQLDGIVENGKSVFDTAMITISTESGNGQHNAEELRNVFHAINGANGRFKVGGGSYIDIEANGIDVYNTMLMAHGVPASGRLWDGRGDVGSKILL